MHEFPISIAILNGTCSLRALILFCGDEPAIKTKKKKKTYKLGRAGWPLRSAEVDGDRRVESLFGCTSSSTADTSNSYVAKYILVSILLHYLVYLFCFIACSVIL